MGSETRKSRVAGILEEQFYQCDEVLRGCIAVGVENGSYKDFEFRNVLAMLKASAQLAAAIARLEAGRDKSLRPHAENFENRGSIPQ